MNIVFSLIQDFYRIFLRNFTKDIHSSRHLTRTGVRPLPPQIRERIPFQAPSTTIRKPFNTQLLARIQNPSFPVQPPYPFIPTPYAPAPSAPPIHASSPYPFISTPCAPVPSAPPMHASSSYPSNYYAPIMPSVVSAFSPTASQPITASQTVVQRPVGLAAIQAQDSLIQSLQNQLDILQKESQTLIEELVNKPKLESHTRLIQPLSPLHYQDNIDKLGKLTQLSKRLKNISDFCNKEMLEVLEVVTEGHQQLRERLTKLREESGAIEEEDLLCENIAQIAALEKAEVSLKQLEKKFQEMQKSLSESETAGISTQNDQEAHISTLLGKIEHLHGQKRFLQECKQNLPSYALYDLHELQQYMQIFKAEGEELSQKTSQVSQKLNHSEKFAHDLTNHLLDYARILRGCFGQLQRQAHPVEAPLTGAQRMTSIPTPVKNMYTLIEAPVAKQAQLKTEDGPCEALLQATQEVTQAITSLIRTTKPTS